MKKGSFFKTSEQHGVIINETLANIIEWEDFEGQLFNTNDFVLPIIGVIKNFHFNSFYEEIQPLSIRSLSDKWLVNY